MQLTKENIKPVGNRVLIEPYKQASTTEGGLILSEGDGYASPVIGTIVATGDTATYNIGDIVMMRRYSVDSLKVYAEDGEKEIYLLECSEIIAKVQSGQVGPPERKTDYSKIKELKDAKQRTEEVLKEEQKSNK